MNFIDDSCSIIFSFPNDKIDKKKRTELAKAFSEILGVSTLVCDKDCEITVIKHRNGSYIGTKTMI